MKRGRRSSEWAVAVGQEDRDRARAVLIECLRSGTMHYDEYERRMLKVERARWMPELYDATFGKARLPFGGSRWRRRRRRAALGSAILGTLLCVGGLLWPALLVAGAVVLGVGAFVVVAVTIQQRRFPPLYVTQWVGGLPH